VSWRINLSSDSHDQLDRLSEEDRGAVLEELVSWVEDGPPLGREHYARGRRLVEHQLEAGFTVIYFNHAPEDYVTVVYIGRPASSP
jgi:hypothetical protein